MRLSHRHFPHPVLSEFSNDFPGQRFEYHLCVQPTPDGSGYTFSADFSLTSQTILELISSGQAFFALHIECPGSRFRTLLTTTDRHLESTIGLDMLDGEVEVIGLVLAATDLEEYASQEFNADYSGYSFRIRQGDILALGKPKTFYPNKLDARPSIFVLARNPGSDEIDYKLDSDQIVIYVADHLLQKYKAMAKYQEHRVILNSMIVLPVLVSVLHVLRRPEYVVDEQDDQDYRTTHTTYRHKRWYRVLERGLAKLGIREWIIENPVTTANKLLQDVLSKALETLYNEEVVGDEVEERVSL